MRASGRNAIGETANDEYQERIGKWRIGDNGSTIILLLASSLSRSRRFSLAFAISQFAARSFPALAARSERNLSNSPSWALLDSNAGQSGNDHLLESRGWRESNRQKGPFRWVPDRGYFLTAKYAPPPFSRRIVFRHRRTPQIGVFTICGYRILERRSGGVARAVEGLPG
jgi:hypothetical protein